MLISNFMPTTLLTQAGTGACLSLCYIISSFGSTLWINSPSVCEALTRDEMSQVMLCDRLLLLLFLLIQACWRKNKLTLHVYSVLGAIQSSVSLGFLWKCFFFYTESGWRGGNLLIAAKNLRLKMLRLNAVWFYWRMGLQSVAQGQHETLWLHCSGSL